MSSSSYDRFADGWLATIHRRCLSDHCPTVCPCPTPGDPGLTATRTDRAVRVEEELVLSDLVNDLEAQTPTLEFRPTSQ